MEVKTHLADVQILSRILKYTVSELAELSVDDIIACIDQTHIEVGTASLEPRMKNLGKITGSNTEDSSLGEGKIL